MPNLTNIPFSSPVKFYINTTTPGLHLDNDFACNQIKSFETRVCYWQKWQVGDQSKMQIVTSVAPAAVKVYTGAGVLTTTEFAWTLVGNGGSLAINLYECLINMDALPVNGFYHLYFECTLLSYSAKFVSEKIHLRALHPNTLLFSYRNSYNKLGVFWSTGLVMHFRCEAGLMDYQPEVEGADFTDQVHDVSILSATPFDTFKLYVGTAPGVANYVIKILNYIFACDSVNIRRNLSDPGTMFTKPVGEKWEATRVKGFPQFGWATTVQPSFNADSLQYNDAGHELAPGIVLAYNIDTNLFSTEHVEIVHITEVTTI